MTDLADDVIFWSFGSIYNFIEPEVYIDLSVISITVEFYAITKCNG